MAGGGKRGKNPLRGTRFERVWAAGTGMADSGAVSVGNAGDGTGGGYECEVRSQADSETRYAVRNSAGRGWTCSCPSYARGRRICKHIVAAFIRLSGGAAGPGEDDGSAGRLQPPPPRQCPHCGGTDCGQKEERRPGRVPNPKGGDGSAVCACRACGRTFADRPGFSGRHYPERVILRVLRAVARNMSPLDAARTVNEEDGTRISERTARRWASDYSSMIYAYAEGLAIGGGEAVSVDEKFYKSRGERRWVYTAICLKSRFVAAVHHFGDRPGHDATGFFQDVERRIGRPPVLLISDKLNGYKIGYRRVFKSDPPTTLYLMDASVNGRHVNNSIHERGNGSLTPCILGARGFNSDRPGRIILDIIYRNFVRPHGGLDGATPAEKEGIGIPGPDKLLTLIRCAAASGFNFA